LESLIGIVLSSFFVAISGAVMPGPVLTATIAESAKRGFLAGPMIVLGHGILETGLLVLIVLGFADLIRNPGILGSISLAGGAVLLWLSYGMLKDLKNLSLDLVPATRDSKGPILAGITTSLANPYWTIWWATVGLGYVIMSMKFGITGVILFFIGHISADLAWYSFISFLISRGKKHINDKVYRGVIGACAMILIAFAFYFSFLGLTYLIA
jgi:threonine/homoserine/homoserine lactone efflux protein